MSQHGDLGASANPVTNQVLVGAGILAIWACKLTILGITVYALRSQRQHDADHHAEENEVAGSKLPVSRSDDHAVPDAPATDAENDQEDRTLPISADAGRNDANVHVHVSTGDSATISICDRAAINTGDSATAGPAVNKEAVKKDVSSLNSLEQMAPLTAESTNARVDVSNNNTFDISVSTNDNHVLDMEKKDAVIQRMVLAHKAELESRDQQHRATIAFLTDEHAELVAALREDHRVELEHQAHEHHLALAYQRDDHCDAFVQQAETHGQALSDQRAEFDRAFETLNTEFAMELKERYRVNSLRYRRDLEQERARADEAEKTVAELRIKLAVSKASKNSMLASLDVQRQQDTVILEEQEQELCRLEETSKKDIQGLKKEVEMWRDLLHAASGEWTDRERCYREDIKTLRTITRGSMAQMPDAGVQWQVEEEDCEEGSGDKEYDYGDEGYGEEEDTAEATAVEAHEKITVGTVNEGATIGAAGTEAIANGLDEGHNNVDHAQQQEHQGADSNGLGSLGEDLGFPDDEDWEERLFPDSE